jgi:hypothetical protein
VFDLYPSPESPDFCHCEEFSTALLSANAAGNISCPAQQPPTKLIIQSENEKDELG